MPQLETYKLTNPDTGKTITVSLPREPSQEEVGKIFESRIQQDKSLAQADEASNLWTSTGLKKAGLDVGKTALKAAPMAAATVFAPEVFGPLALGQSAADAVKQAYEYYKNPDTANKIQLAAPLAQGLLMGALGLRSKTPRINAEFTDELPSFKDVSHTPVSESAPQSLNAQQIPQVNAPQTRAQIGTSPIVTPPPSPRLSLPAPETGPIITPPPAPIRGLLKGRISRASIKKQSKIEEETPAAKEETTVETKQEPIENKWIREQESSVLQSMREGSTGKLREEIDTVLGERNLSPKETQTKTEKIQTESKFEPGFDEETFNSYNDRLDNLPAYGKNAGSSLLRDVVALGKKAGLDKETIKNDILENLHPEIVNPTGRVNIAIQRVFSPKPEE